LSTASAPVSLERDGEIALITIDHPPVNALSKDLRAGLIAALEEALADASVRAIVLGSAGAAFCAGADIREFEGPPQPPHLTDVIQRFEDSPKPVVVALHGSVLGGGCELAAGCHYRVAARDTRVGLPEVNLGLLPGAGGTQRLPRLIGFDSALAMMLDGKPRRIGDATLQGFADRIADDDVRATALAFGRELAEMGSVPRRTGSLAPPEWTPEIFERHSKAARKRRGEPAPSIIVAAVRRAIDMPFADAVVYARADFLALRDTVEADALRYAFFAERQAVKPGPEVAPRSSAPARWVRASPSPCSTRDALSL
jgi:3-hydroxyacyl-CoA dehydrogenase